MAVNSHVAEFGLSDVEKELMRDYMKHSIQSIKIQDHDGIVYGSIGDAAKRLGLSAKAIWYLLKNGHSSKHPGVFLKQMPKEKMIETIEIEGM